MPLSSPAVPYHDRMVGTDSASPPSRWRRRRLVAGLVAVLVGVWVVVALALLIDARRHAYAGLDKLEKARETLTPKGLVEGEGVELLNAAETDFRSAHGSVASPLLAPLRVLPVLGRQVRAVGGMTDGAAEVIATGIEAIDGAGDALDSVNPTGAERIEVVRHIGAVAVRAAGRLREVDLGPGNALVGPVRRARERFDEELEDLRRSIDDLTGATDALAHLLTGPSRYLVLAANNAEMRVGSGTFLSVGVLAVEDGEFELGEMHPTQEFAVPAGAVSIDGDLADRWGWLEPNREWRNLGVSPRFETQGALAAQMWKARTGEQVDGVLALDPIALRALLAATGPVEIEGVQIGARNVVSEILLEQYRGLVGYPEEQPRRDRLNAIASAAVKNLESGEWEAVDLVDELRVAAAGRHVLAWSAHEADQRGWLGAGIAGDLEGESLLLGVHNRGGNKLDQFLEVRAAVTVAAAEGETDVSVTVEMFNNTPEGLPQYVAGPFPGAEGAVEGLYQGLLVAELPHLARDLYMTDEAGERLDLVAAGADGPAWVVATYVEVPRGRSRSVVVRFRLPSGSRALVVEPSARVPAVRWTFEGRAWSDEAGRRIEWDD